MQQTVGLLCTKNTNSYSFTSSMDQALDHISNYFASVLELFTTVRALTTPKTFCNRLICS